MREREREREREEQKWVWDLDRSGDAVSWWSWWAAVL
jgi:hypothetical protein